MRLTIQLCTYKRAHLLGRVLEALFDQTLSADAYEVVLVNDGSPDDTNAVVERVRPLARCAFTYVTQPNGGLANARNTGLARARGDRILFMDDDVLATPVLAAEHLASDARHGDAIVRGAVINTESFDELPVPVWTLANYSGNYFWTTNVSVRRARLDRVGGRFDESFTEYGWEDIELGMRLRAIGTRSVFNRFALVFHHKPRPTGASVEGILRQVRAQARTAVQFRAKHPHWRVDLAIGTTPPQRWLGTAVHRSGIARALGLLVGDRERTGRLSLPQQLASHVLATDAYYDELERAERGA
jgi:glycosyltransferase involved in cell wall biosynthesis